MYVTLVSLQNPQTSAEYIQEAQPQTAGRQEDSQLSVLCLLRRHLQQLWLIGCQGVVDGHHARDAAVLSILLRSCHASTHMHEAPS